MKWKVVVFALFITVCAPTSALRVLAAHNDDALLSRAQTRYANISRNLPRYRVVKRALRESSEGGELVAYFDGENLRRIVANNYSETGRARDEYSFDNGKIFFAHRTEERYDLPTDESKSVLEAGIIRRRTDERFYFHNGKLFRRVALVRESKKPLRSSVTSGTTQKDREETARVLADARRYLQIVQSPPRDE